MRFTTSAFILGVVFLAGGLSFHFIGGGSDLPRRLQEQEGHLEEISRASAEHASELRTHEEKIRASRTMIEDHEVRLKELARRLGEVGEQVASTEKRIAEAEEAGAARAEEIQRLSSLLEKLRSEHAALAVDYRQRAEEIQALREKQQRQDEVNAEFDQRLRELEKGSGRIVTP